MGNITQVPTFLKCSFTVRFILRRDEGGANSHHRLYSVNQLHTRNQVHLLKQVLLYLSNKSQSHLAHVTSPCTQPSCQARPY